MSRLWKSFDIKIKDDEIKLRLNSDLDPKIIDTQRDRDDEWVCVINEPTWLVLMPRDSHTLNQYSGSIMWFLYKEDE